MEDDVFVYFDMVVGDLELLEVLDELEDCYEYEDEFEYVE